MKRRYAVILWVQRPSYQTLVSETIPLEKKGGYWFCPDGKLQLRQLGLQRIDGDIGKVVEVAVEQPQFRNFSDYFIFVSQTEAEADAFAAGCLTTNAARDLETHRIMWEASSTLYWN